VRILIKQVSKQSETKYCFQVLVTCIQVLASKLLTNAKFQNLQDLNSRTFQGFSSTFKHLICFQALSRALKFLFQIQAFSGISQARYEPCMLLEWYLAAPVCVLVMLEVYMAAEQSILL